MMILWIIGLLAVCFVVVALVYGLALVGKKSEEQPKDHEPPLTIIHSEESERMWGGVEIFMRVNGRLPLQGDTLTTQMLEDFIDKFAEHPTHGYWVPLAKELLEEKNCQIRELLDKKRGETNGRPAVEKDGENDSTDVRDNPAPDEGH